MNVSVRLERYFCARKVGIATQSPAAVVINASAIPVARLHKKVGMLELKSFEFVTDDYAVQKTVFSDGTEVVANISDTDKVTEKYGTIKANSWRTV